ncbi:MAG: restriction endonuclease subunit S, partial [Alphaproteobacteria bacterium]
MSVAPYPEYKDSGVEWIGTIPTHWQLGRLSSLASVLNGFPFDATQFDPNDGVPLVRIRDLNASTSAVFFRGDVVHEAFITSDDVLIGMDGDFNVGRWKGAEPALLNQRMCCLRGPTDFIRFLEYALPKPLKLINDVTYSTTVKHLSAGQVRNIRIAYPPSLPERFTILDFLDQETGKIDALVAEQERLIALLKEKRQAVISQAVTKGLNPNAPMKDSGIEWLGQVPAHWEVKRVKHITRSIEQGWSPQCDGFPVSSDSEWGVLKVGCVNGGRFNPEENKSLPAELTPI